MITSASIEELRHQIILMRDDADQIRQLEADDPTEQALLLLATGRLVALSQVLLLLNLLEPKV